MVGKAWNKWGGVWVEVQVAGVSDRRKYYGG